MQEIPDLFIDPIAFVAYFWLQILQLLLLLLLYFIMTRVLRRSLRAMGVGPEASSGIVLITRLILFAAVVMVIISFFSSSFATILSVSTLFGTAIGLAFSQALGNIVSGLYVFAARPFRVGDYVKIGSVEGIVREITLNYTEVLLPDETTQLVPNSKVVTSEVTNYRIEMSDFIERSEEMESNGDSSVRRSMRRALYRLKDMTGYDDAYRYTFELTFHMNFDHQNLRITFDNVCKNWTTKFLSFIVANPMDIIRYGSEFKDDLLQIYWSGKA
jgi:flagellar basal body-associated protein FliL